MKYTLPSALGAIALLLCTTSVLNAQIYTESGDAGGNQAGAQASGLTQAGTIFGSLGTINDADVFSLTITNTMTIMFSTVNALTGTSGGAGGLDTQLFLFTSSGQPVFANDDANGLTVQSTLPAGNNFLATLAAGTYYIAISLSGNDPVNLNNQLVFLSSADPTAVRGPASGTSPTNWNGFDNNAAGGPNGSYQIDISAVPEPSTIALYILGVAALFCAPFKRYLRKRAAR